MAKVVKWNTDDVSKVVSGYDGTPESVAQLAEDLGRSTRSVIGKLASLSKDENSGVTYVAAVKPGRKTPVDDGPTKQEYLDAIEATGFDIAGFQGATKPALKNLATLTSAVIG